MKITVNETVTKMLTKLAGQVTGQQASMVGARSLTEMLKKHFTELDSSHPNKMHGKRTNFWSDQGRQTSDPKPAGSDSAVITVGDLRLPQKIYGGKIVPKNKKYLAIPANATAYGRKPSSFGKDGLHVEVIGGANGAKHLALVVGPKKITRKWNFRGSMGEAVESYKSTHAQGEVMYWLKKSVTQAPTPYAMPKKEEMSAAVNAGISRWLSEQVQKVKVAA